MKEIYRNLCQKEDLPIFLQDWWLDAVCGEDKWFPCLVFDKNKNVIGASFYYTKIRYGLKTITQPPLTPFSGVWIKSLPADAFHKKMQYEADILTEIAKQLPKTHFLAQHFHFSLTNILPLHWLGFESTVRYTYCIENITDLGIVFSNFNKNARRNISDEEFDFEISKTNNIDKIFELVKKSNHRAGGDFPFSKIFLQNIANQAIINDKIAIYELFQDQKTLGAILIIWDKTTAYLLLAGLENEAHRSVMAKLIWFSIQDITKIGINNFDFDGSMYENVEQLNRSFGGERKPYFRVTKSKNRFWKLIALLLNR